MTDTKQNMLTMLSKLDSNLTKLTRNIMDTPEYMQGYNDATDKTVDEKRMRIDVNYASGATAALLDQINKLIKEKH